MSLRTRSPRHDIATPGHRQHHDPDLVLVKLFMTYSAKIKSMIKAGEVMVVHKEMGAAPTKVARPVPRPDKEKAAKRPKGNTEGMGKMTSFFKAV